MTIPTLNNGWTFEPVMFNGTKPIAWVGVHPAFGDRLGNVAHFTECPACFGIGKDYDGFECYLCKETVK